MKLSAFLVCSLFAASLYGQIPPPAGKTRGPGVQAAADDREADLLKTCKVPPPGRGAGGGARGGQAKGNAPAAPAGDRKSTRLNSSH